MREIQGETKREGKRRFTGKGVHLGRRRKEVRKGERKEKREK